MNRYSAERDLTHKQPIGGVGHRWTFMCPRCGKEGKPIEGRRQQMVRGMRCWVCADCVAQKVAA